MRAWQDALDAEEGVDDTDDWNAECGAASDAFHASLDEVLTVQPTTMAGVAALLDHVGQEEFLGMSPGGDPDHYETVLTTYLNMDEDDYRQREMARDFPLRLAATMRAIMGAQS